MFVSAAATSAPLPSPRLDAEIVSPGLVDLQVNGGFGLEVGGDAQALRALAARLPSTGVTTFLPTAVSAGAADYRALAAALAAARGAAGARMPGPAPGGPAAVAGAGRRSPRRARLPPRARRWTRCWTTCSARAWSGW